jgi:hypothetical protein
MGTLLGKNDYQRSSAGRMRRVFVVNERKLADVRGGLVKKMMFWRRDKD